MIFRLLLKSNDKLICGNLIQFWPSSHYKLVVHARQNLYGDLCMWIDMYRQVSNIRCTKSQHLKDSRTV